MSQSIAFKLNKALFKADSGTRKRLWKKLSTLLKNGVPMKSALETMRTRRVEMGKAGAPDTIALGHWIALIKNGSPLSGCITGWVTDEEGMLIASGEKSGDLIQALESINKIMTAKSGIQTAIIAGVSYPIVLVFMLFGMLFLSGYKLVPEFLKIAPIEKFTGLGYVIAKLALLAKTALFPIMGIFVLSVIVFLYTLPRWNSDFRIKLDQVKPYSVYRIIQGSSWLISFAALVKSGTRIEDGLSQLAKLSNPWLKVRLLACLKGVRSGLSVGQALMKSGYQFPDKEIIDDLVIYSSLKGFEKSLDTLGAEWIMASELVIQSQMKIVFNVMLVFTIVLIGFMVGGMIDLQLQLRDIIQTHH